MSRAAAHFRQPKPRGQHTAGIPNDLEILYRDTFLLPRQLSGEVERISYEPDKLRLCRLTTLTPDWRVDLTAGGVEYHEVKGGMVEEDSWIKLKFAAALYPDLKFFICQRKRKLWTVKLVPNDPPGPLAIVEGPISRKKRRKAKCSL